MRIKVMKFGGTSVATPENRALAAMRVISAKEQGFSPVVVVSAVGRRGSPYATDTLLDLLRQVDPSIDPDPRESDLMLACGEIISSSIFTHTLKTLGQAAMSFRGGQAGIRTDGVYGNARIKGINPSSIKKCLEEGKIAVVCGFQGVYISGRGEPGAELTTLGRGGSDTTASALGAALSAEAVEIFTDVNGIKTSDPDLVPDAPTLTRVTYDEVAELAHLGAKVVHPRAAEIAMQYGIPMWVKSTFTDDLGTEIVPREGFPGRRVTGISHTAKLVHLAFDMSEATATERANLQSSLYELIASNQFNLYMLNLSPSGTGFAVPRDQYPMLEDLIDGLLLPLGDDGRRFFLFQLGKEPSREVEAQSKLFSKFDVRRIRTELTEGCTMVSVIGHEYMQQPGVFLRALKTLHKEQVPVFQTSDSDYSLSCLIPESDMRRAVKALHDEFELAGAR